MKKNIHIVIVLAIISLFSLTTGSKWKGYEMKPPYQFVSDVDQYYSYLPAAFIHHDLSFSFPNGYWLVENKNGKKLQKMPVGMSMMFTPFFLVGHAIANNTDYKTDGYSKPYSISIWYGTLFYFLFGIFFLIKSLDNYFNKWISGITVLLLFFGTNLMFYVLNLGEMSHSYLFVLFSICIYLTIKWHKSPKKRYLFLFAFFFGLAVIIRPSEIIFALFFLLFSVYNKETLIAKLNLIKTHYLQFLIAAIIFFIPIFPQLLYWKVYGGDWFVYSYGTEENFFFNDPKIFDFLLSYRKGWFTYTPIMLFSIIGLFFLPKRIKDMKLVTPVFIGLVIYVLSSWWCWWFGGSFGNRAMIQYYGVLAFPFAAFLHYLSQRKIRTIIVTPVILFFTYYSLLYTYKYRYWSLHWDGMSKESYWYTFMKPTLSQSEIEHMETLHVFPNYEEAKKGNR